ncbi:hypothetical protein [Thalassobacillus devorans]|uniref:hypothetical protein n=1 Tax=Thalassobacillus devorans TaxID=279813 RepID=UPI000490AC25|nr:hypothetical protein [Thalassobacillus devorans]
MLNKKGFCQNIKMEVMALKQQLGQLGTTVAYTASNPATAMQKDIFTEVSHQGHTENPPQEFQ